MYVGCLNTHLLPNSMFVKSDLSNKTHKRKIPQALRTGLLKVTVGFVFMYNIMVFFFICHYNLFGIMLGMTIDMDGICKQLMLTCHIIYNVACKHQLFAYASIKSSGEFLHICKLVRASIA